MKFMPNQSDKQLKSNALVNNSENSITYSADLHLFENNLPSNVKILM